MFIHNIYYIDVPINIKNNTHYMFCRIQRYAELQFRWQNEIVIYIS